jgi:predicted DNA-binding antitoxin AbrB/MazE fold protein
VLRDEALKGKNQEYSNSYTKIFKNGKKPIYGDLMSITVRARIKDGIIYPKEDLHLKEGDVTVTIEESITNQLAGSLKLKDRKIMQEILEMDILWD